jgi:crotonobetainyl-CoA:carnitine CoA-transferase CaiB-like acyl-CoA transferase
MAMALAEAGADVVKVEPGRSKARLEKERDG